MLVYQRVLLKIRWIWILITFSIWPRLKNFAREVVWAACLWMSLVQYISVLKIFKCKFTIWMFCVMLSATSSCIALASMSKHSRMMAGARHDSTSCPAFMQFPQQKAKQLILHHIETHHKPPLVPPVKHPSWNFRVVGSDSDGRLSYYLEALQKS